MENMFLRTAALLGNTAMQKLQGANIAIFGIGGVGGYTLEALVRSGVGNIDVFDNDTVDITNINRQIIATADNIGSKKTDEAIKRARSINPEINIKGYDIFYLPETADGIDLSVYDYIVDAVDTVSAKLELIVRAQQLNVPIISVMGAGNKTDATRLLVSDIYKTSGCPLARVMRTELKKRGIKRQQVVWSDETPRQPEFDLSKDNYKKRSPSSAVFVPACAGLIAAQVVVDYISKK